MEIFTPNAGRIRFSFLSALLTATTLIIFSSRIFAGDIKVKEGAPDLTVKTNTYLELGFTSSFTDISYRTVKTVKGMFTEITVPGYGYSDNTGDPKLPVLKKIIEIPAGAVPTVNVISYTVKEFRLSEYGIPHQLIPAQAPVSKDLKKKLPAFEYNNTVYETNEFSNADLVTVDVLGIMRGERLARLNIAPVRYNPVTNTIRVYNDIVVEITFPGADVAQTITMKENASSFYFESMFGMQVLNYKANLVEKDLISTYPVKFVIVADPMFQAALQPLIQWKTKKGFNVIEAYTDNVNVGNTTSSIKSYLQGLYEAGTPSDPAPTFVLFVGDIAQVPSFAGVTGSHVTDLYYCEYTGDFLPEVYYGRFSATNVNELQPQIDKTLEYEQYLMPDPAFLNEVVMIAGQDGTYGPLHGDGQINYGTDTYFNTFHGLTSHTYLFAVSGSSSSQIIQDVSRGVCMANYTAHGSSGGWADPSFGISDIASLANNHKYPLMIGNCCETNRFEVGACFGEALLRANGKGALGYIGGSNSTYWDEDYWWGCGYKTVVVNPVYDAATPGSYDGTFHDHGEPISQWYASQDQMVYAGNLAVTQSGSSTNEYYWEVYHLMGDPSLMIYYGLPPALSATYTPLLPLGSTTFTVTTEPYAYAALSMNGVLYGAALADEFGVAEIQVDPLSTPGTADVVVTRQNRSPFIGTVIIASPSGPYVAYVNKVLHDLTGNNNSQADFSENITLDVSLQNYGASTATGVVAKLSTTDNYITITDSLQAWGTIANGASSTQNNAYAFTVADLVPDQHSVLFDLEITDNSSNIWTGSFSIMLNAPYLAIGTVTVDDAAGNGNGRLDPGETVNIIISSSNAGHAPAANTTSNLAFVSGPVTINTGADNLGTLNALTGNANAEFNITVNPNAVMGSLASFNNILAAGAYSVQQPINLMVGLVDEDWESGDFTMFNWMQGTHPWSTVTEDPYEGAYCSKSGYILDLDSSVLRITMNVLANDSISFYKKVSSEASYDYLKFYIDNVKQAEWCGEGAGWSRSAFAVPAGTHTFKWIYEKDVNVSNGSDCAWIDFILFPPVEMPVGINDHPAGSLTMNCYPNPFSHETVIAYSLQENSKVTLKVFNAVGQEITSLVDGENKPAGTYSVVLNAELLGSGIFHCVLTADDKTTVRKLIIIK